MKKAFTLIELIIIIVIISLLFSAMIAYYNKANEQKKLTTAMQKLDDVLHLIQKKAIAGDIYTTCDNFTGYQIQFIGNNQYAAYFCCNDICDNPDYLIKNYTLDSPLTLNPSIDTIYFKPLTGRIDSNDAITVKITNSTINKCSLFSIEPSGLMTLTDTCTP